MQETIDFIYERNGQIGELHISKEVVIFSEEVHISVELLQALSICLN